MKANVLDPFTKIELYELLDKKSLSIIRYFIKKSLFSQPEILPQQNIRAVEIPKQHIEQWFVQALNVEPVGSGSFPIDIYNKKQNWGADIKMLNIKVNDDGCITNSDSGEASLGQKFISYGTELDSLFLQKQYEQIKNGWLKIIRDKHLQVKKFYPSIKHIYYLFILRANVSFYFIGCKVNLKNLINVSVNTSRTTNNSVFLDGFISNLLGNVKIYKAKKRMELRLKPKNWIDNNLFIGFKTNFSNKPAILRNGELSDEILIKRLSETNNTKIEIF
jgi:hypothetical protein